jgi:MSHA biogenesis protein MshK
LAFNTLALLVSVAASAAGVSALDDPTRPLVQRPAQVQADEQPDQPRLTSVLIDADRKLAVINGELMGEGDRHQGIRVWKIAADHAVVTVDGGAPLTLVLDEPSMHGESR